MNDIYEFVNDNKSNERKLNEELSIIAANIDIKCFRCKAVKAFKISDLLKFESMYQFVFQEFDKEVGNNVDIAMYI
ncbi:hypothetical protein [Fusibacter bizertensis]